MPLFLMGCFPVDFQEVKRLLRTKLGKRPIKVGKRPIKEGKRPIKAMVLVGISVGCLMGCFWAPPAWRKTAPLKRPSKRSMIHSVARRVSHQIPSESEMSRQNRATPPPNQGVAPFSGPPCCTFLSFEQAGGAAGWWRVSRHFWVPKTDRTTGGYPISQLQSHQSRYSVQLRAWAAANPKESFKAIF